MFVDPSGLDMNTVYEFINNYGATCLYDNNDEKYTMIELNGLATAHFDPFVKPFFKKIWLDHLIKI